ncbi:uncharacterized protein LOC121734075 [Aricia agestis]|uniref:uncharacterized protein LOC121734075 n=1 Tax=Aricia agestis TaxID=91739 RepID=UPI001C2049A6|nr:uncharacterized protein LOC121734075 [Aricia agestis]
MSIDIPDCTKLPLSEHIEAYNKRNKVTREHVDSIQCNQDLVEKVIYNYLIVKRILKNLYWQDLMVCKHVCKTWHAAIKSLALECRGPREFGIIFKPGRSEFIKSGNLNVRPLLVLTFICVKYKEIMIRECKSIVPKTCQPSCGEYHCFLDIVDKFTNAPKDCMITVICKKSEDRFIPLPVEDVPYNSYFVSGLYIPIIPQVRCRRIIIRPEHPFHCLSITSSIDRIVAKNEIFKGVIVFASNDMFGNALNSTVSEHLKEVQPNVPFAIGGCVTECTIKHSDVKIKNNTNALNNIMSIIAFTVPKNKENESNFDMFSLILDSKMKTKDNIEHITIF